MITSPSPTQPSLAASESEKKEVKLTPIRRRLGETPAALTTKTILRPVLKGFYYTLQGIKGHKLFTLGLILLLLASIFATTYATTGALPYGIGKDQFNFNINGGNGGGDHVKNWLYALRDGDTSKLKLIQSELAMSSPPDPAQLTAQYSQSQAHLVWKSINTMGVYTQSDTTVESFVSIDFTGPGPGGEVKGNMIWHFTTLPESQGRLLFVDLVNARGLLQ